MANLPKPTYDENARANLPGTYLKDGMLKQPVTVQIDDRLAVTTADHNGPAVGNYGKVDIPVTIEGQRFIASVAPTSKDYRDLCAVFGPDPQAWIGAVIRLSDNPVLARVTVAPISPAGAEAITATANAGQKRGK